VSFGPATRFRYAGWDLDVSAGSLECRYELDGDDFVERYRFAGDLGRPGVDEAARLLYLLAGVSYYKAGAPPLVDLGDTPLRDGDAAIIRDFYLNGLGEFAFRNRLDLGGLRLVGGRRAGPPARARLERSRPLVPFGGGIDSIVTAESVRTVSDATLFVLSRQGDRFAAIEAAADVARLPVARAERLLDPRILDSGARGYLNGHVPVTGVVSAAAVLVAVLGGHDAVVMSNEWSASVGTVVEGGREVNHQYSKGKAFEDALRGALRAAFVEPPEYFSLLRPYSELWVARRFARLEAYHPVFRSCNRAFHVDPAARLEQWCGVCAKCCFVDLVLAPFVPARTLRAVFAGAEPLENPSLLPQFEALVGRGAPKPFECVGDVDECAVAAAVAAERADRAGCVLLGKLADPALTDGLARLLDPLGPTNTPAAYAPADLLG
jgi:hypothetical protein